MEVPKTREITRETATVVRVDRGSLVGLPVDDGLDDPYWEYTVLHARGRTYRIPIRLKDTTSSTDLGDY